MKKIFNEELNYFHPLIPQLLDTRCIISRFLHKEKGRGTIQIRHSDEDNRTICPFWENILSVGRGQGAQKRSSFEKQEKNGLGNYLKVLRREKAEE